MGLIFNENYSLKPYNTFGIDVSAARYTEVTTTELLKECLEWIQYHAMPSMVLGGGSNVLFTRNFDGVVIRNGLKGIRKVDENEDYIYVQAAAGEVWHEFVLYCLSQQYAGVENLALIPGLVGASPLQNIGAYGVELKEVFHELTAIHRQTQESVVFSNSDCAFGYRESIFKNRYKNEFVITSVTYRLNKKPHFNIEYGAIRQELEKRNVAELTVNVIADAVMAIRNSKLPNPTQIGNAGSFFKNPSVSPEKYAQLKQAYPPIIAYPNPDGTMKLAAGWMIEQCGLKGYRKGDAGIHEKQALVLVNYGQATGEEIVALKNLIIDQVEAKFGVKLAPEVNIF